jgi:anthranilate phosphoribosyltransferase
MFVELIEKLRRRHDLTEHEASEAMGEIMSGRVTPAQISGMLIALSMKGECLDEIVGFARAMRSHGVRVLASLGDVFDTCGTGGDGMQTFNVSSLSALVLAACGVSVAKHGNRSISSKCGSADLFEALGVNITAEPKIVERCLTNVGLAFFFAPTFHPAMRHAAQVRRDLAVRTVFNLLGPLTNPAEANRQIIGVPGPEHTGLLASALLRLGSKKSWVVHSADGLDEISIGGHTKVSECYKGIVHTFYLHPSDFGIATSDLSNVQVANLKESVGESRKVLEGSLGPARDFVLVNAAAGLLVSEHVSSLTEGVQMAGSVLDNGDVTKKLSDLVECSQESEK